MNKTLIFVFFIFVVLVFLLYYLNPCKNFDGEHYGNRIYCKDPLGNLTQKACWRDQISGENLYYLGQESWSALFYGNNWNDNLCVKMKSNWFWGEKKTSGGEFYRKLSEINESCNGCVVDFSLPIV